MNREAGSYIMSATNISFNQNSSFKENSEQKSWIRFCGFANKISEADGDSVDKVSLDFREVETFRSLVYYKIWINENWIWEVGSLVALING